MEVQPFTRTHSTYLQTRYCVLYATWWEDIYWCTCKWYGFLCQSLNLFFFFNFARQIRALEKRNKAGKFAKKIKAKRRKKMHELSNPLEPDEFADMWKDDEWSKVPSCFSCCKLPYSHNHHIFVFLLFSTLFLSLPLMDQKVIFSCNLKSLTSKESI